MLYEPSVSDTRCFTKEQAWYLISETGPRDRSYTLQCLLLFILEAPVSKRGGPMRRQKFSDIVLTSVVLRVDWNVRHVACLPPQLHALSMKGLAVSCGSGFSVIPKTWYFSL